MFWLAAALPAAAGLLGQGLAAGGIGKGRYQQVGGASDEELERLLAQGRADAAEARRVSMAGGAQAMRSQQSDVLRALGERAAQMGTARSGMLPGAAASSMADVDAALARLAAMTQAQELGAQGQARSQFLAGKAGQRFQYEPGWSEQLASLGGGLAGAALPAVGAYYGAGGGLGARGASMLRGMMPGGTELSQADMDFLSTQGV